MFWQEAWWVGPTQTRGRDEGLSRCLHMEELGLQGLHKQLLSHSLCQGVCNHLRAREHVFCIQTASHSLLQTHVSSHSPQICQRGLLNQGQADIWPQVTMRQLHSITAMRSSWNKEEPWSRLPHSPCVPP